MTTEVDSRILEALLRMSRQLDELPGAIAAAMSKPASLSTRDRERLSQLLPRLSARVLDCEFVLSNLQIQAQRDKALRDALDACGLAPKSLGKLFARAVNFEVNGLRLVRVGKERDGVVWRVACD